VFQRRLVLRFGLLGIVVPKECNHGHLGEPLVYQADQCCNWVVTQAGSTYRAVTTEEMDDAGGSCSRVVSRRGGREMITAIYARKFTDQSSVSEKAC
jgi:hypothetical protein